MNNIYVDELPKSCLFCPFCADIKVNGGMTRLLFCKAYKFNKWKLMKDIDKCFNKCEIKNKFKPLSDRLAEERKKIIERIRDLAEIYTEPSAKGFDFETYILTEENLNKILDKVEKWKG